jgi:iron complex outermembrane recepter protein
MKHMSNGQSCVRCRRAKDALPPGKVSINAAVFFALYGVPYAANAQQQGDQAGTLQEVVVTASRREQAPEAVPYSLSVVSGDQLARTGVTDVTSLASQVPGLSLYDLGTRFSGATTPIIRGLNASGAPSGFRTFEQSPVGTYIGNSPIDGYFELDDVQRIEVLRGPQGTLYGAGALGGALRIIPNSPELGRFAGDIEAGGGTVAHANGASYTTSALFNVPIGDTLALRVSGKYAYEPGFINIYGLLERTGSSPLSAVSTLADPADAVNSPGIITGKNDWNDQNTFTGRASLLWKPVDKFTAELAFMYADVNGDGGPTDNLAFPGGPYPIDPRITFPSHGEQPSRVWI